MTVTMVPQMASRGVAHTLINCHCMSDTRVAFSGLEQHYVRHWAPVLAMASGSLKLRE